MTASSRSKPASLFAASCKIGAIIAAFRRSNATKSRRSGTTWGWLSKWPTTRWISSPPADKLGKPVHNDLKEGKITLPIISLLQQASPEESQFVADYVNNGSNDEAVPRQVTALLHKYDTLKSTLAKAQETRRSGQTTDRILRVLQSYGHAVRHRGLCHHSRRVAANRTTMASVSPAPP